VESGWVDGATDGGVEEYKGRETSQRGAKAFYEHKA